MLRVVIVEDKREDAEALAQFLKRYCEGNAVAFSVQIYDNPILFLQEYRVDYDLIFMDIEMPHMDGIEVSHKIRMLDDNVPIIIVTNMKRMALKGYQVNAFDFIIKPVNYYGLELTLKKVMKHISKSEKHLLTIPIKFGDRRVDANDVRYVEILSRKLVFHMLNEDITSTGTLKDIEKTLYSYGFRRCNNCFLVNLRYITKIYKDSVYLGEEELAISRPRKKVFLQELTNYWGGAD